MGWHTDFKDRLRLGGEPSFALDFLSPDLFQSDYLSEPRYVLHSHAGPSGSEHIPHAIEGMSGAGQRVNVRSWTSSIGGLRVRLSGVEVAQFVARNIPRGMVAELKVGFEGMDFDDWETVGLYSLQSISGARNQWSIEMSDLFSILQAPDKVTLSAQFYKGAGVSTTVAVDWNNATATASTTLQVADASDFNRDGSADHRGLLYCQPSSGDPFYLKFSAATTSPAHQATIVPVNAIGTTRANLASGDTVTPLGYVFDSVPDVAHRVLFGGLAGSSTMPENWHMDLKYDSHLVNRTDLNEWRARWLSLYANFSGDFIVSNPLENPFRGLEEYLSAFGAWLVFKEGGLSWRFVQGLVDVGTAGGMLPAFDVADYVITDDDIEREDTYQRHHPDAPVEYFQINFPSGNWSDDGRPVVTKPGVFRLNHDSVNRAFDDDVLTSNRTNATTNLKRRIGPWYTRIPDQMNLTLKGWKFAEVVPGDVVSLESQYIRDLITGGAADHYFSDYHEGTNYLVTGVDVDWSGFNTSIQLTTLPRA